MPHFLVDRKVSLAEEKDEQEGSALPAFPLRRLPLITAESCSPGF